MNPIPYMPAPAGSSPFLFHSYWNSNDNIITPDEERLDHGDQQSTAAKKSVHFQDVPTVYHLYDVPAASTMTPEEKAQIWYTSEERNRFLSQAAKHAEYSAMVGIGSMSPNSLLMGNYLDARKRCYTQVVAVEVEKVDTSDYNDIISNGRSRSNGDEGSCSCNQKNKIVARERAMNVFDAFDHDDVSAASTDNSCCYGETRSREGVYG